MVVSVSNPTKALDTLSGYHDKQGKENGVGEDNYLSKLNRSNRAAKSKHV